MPTKRLVSVETLPGEFVARLDNAVRRAYATVSTEPDRKANITVRLSVSFDPGSGDIDATYEIREVLADQSQRTLGKIRDSQLVLPGTEIRNDEPPEEQAYHLPDHGRQLVGV